MAERRKKDSPAVEDIIWGASFDTEAKKDFRCLLGHMANAGKRAYDLQAGKRGRPDLAKIFEYLCDRLDSLDGWRQINDQLHTHIESGSFDDEKSRGLIQCVLLAPVAGQRIWPVLVPKFVFRRKAGEEYFNVYPELRLRLVLLFECEEDKEDPVRVVGYRFEPPEGPRMVSDVGRRDGSHDFVHAQHIHELRKEASIPGAVWLPPHMPAWPIAASDPVSMLVAVWIGLYGRHATYECEGDIKSILRKHATQLPRSPDCAHYCVVGVDKSLHERDVVPKYVVLWDRNDNKKYYEAVVRSRAGVGSGVKVLEPLKAIPSQDCATAFWNIGKP